MKTSILLHIPEPCHENWDAMTNADKGRHCQSCNKIVVDFSVMSDRQVLEYFKTTTGKTCGRFHDDQLQRPLIEPQQKSTKWNYFIASILGFIMTGKLAAQNRITKGKVVGKPAVHRNITKGETVAPRESVDAIRLVGDIAIMDTVKTIEDTVHQKIANKPTDFGDKLLEKINKQNIVENISEKSIQFRLGGVSSFEYIEPQKKYFKGHIVDEKNNAIAAATIKLKGTRLGVSSDINGDFKMKKLGENNKLILVVSSIGYETKEIEITPKDLKGELNIVLKEKKNELGEIIIESGTTIKCTKISGGVSYVRYLRPQKTIKDTVIKKVQQIFNRESIKIYPNPATKKDIIHITIKDAGEYALHFFDTQSRLLTVKNIVTNDNNQTTEFQLPSTVATGTYFIRILNEKTQKEVTEKIIVQ